MIGFCFKKSAFILLLNQRHFFKSSVSPIPTTIHLTISFVTCLNNVTQDVIFFNNWNQRDERNRFSLLGLLCHLGRIEWLNKYIFFRIITLYCRFRWKISNWLLSFYYLILLNLRRHLQITLTSNDTLLYSRTRILLVLLRFWSDWWIGTSFGFIRSFRFKFDFWLFILN